MPDHDELSLAIKLIDRLNEAQKVMDERQYQQASEIDALAGTITVLKAIIIALAVSIVGTILAILMKKGIE